MNKSKKLITGFTILLICCLLAVTTLIAVPIYLPQVQPGGELLIAVTILIISLGMFGYIIIVRQISILNNNITDMANYLIKNHGNKNSMNKTLVDSSIEPSASLASQKTAQESLIKNFDSINLDTIIGELDTERTEPLPKTSNYSVQLDPNEGAIPGEALEKTNQHPLRASVDNFTSQVFETSNQKQSSVNSASDYARTKTGPCLDWILTGVYTLPQKHLRFNLLDILTIKEGGKQLLLSDLHITNISELHIFKQSLLYAIKKIETILHFTTGDLILPINHYLCQDQVFLQMLIVILQNNLNRPTIPKQNNIFYRLRIAIPQKYFDSEQIHQSMSELFKLSPLGLKFAVLGEKTKPINLTRYISLNANMYIANSNQEYFNPTTAAGLESFGSIADLLKANSIETFVMNINSVALLHSYMNFPVSYVSGTELSGVQTYSVLPT